MFVSVQIWLRIRRHIVGYRICLTVAVVDGVIPTGVAQAGGT